MTGVITDPLGVAVCVKWCIPSLIWYKFRFRSENIFLRVCTRHTGVSCLGAATVLRTVRVTSVRGHILWSTEKFRQSKWPEELMDANMSFKIPAVCLRYKAKTLTHFCISDWPGGYVDDCVWLQVNRGMSILLFSCSFSACSVPLSLEIVWKNNHQWIAC